MIVTSPLFPPKENETQCTVPQRKELTREVVTHLGKQETIIRYDNGDTVSSLLNPYEFLKATKHPCGHFSIALDLLEKLTEENKILKRALSGEAHNELYGSPEW